MHHSQRLASKDKHKLKPILKHYGKYKQKYKGFKTTPAAEGVPL